MPHTWPIFYYCCPMDIGREIDRQWSWRCPSFSTNSTMLFTLSRVPSKPARVSTNEMCAQIDRSLLSRLRSSMSKCEATLRGSWKERNSSPINPEGFSFSLSLSLSIACEWPKRWITTELLGKLTTPSTHDLIIPSHCHLHDNNLLATLLPSTRKATRTDFNFMTSLYE